jgi:hypothetical protein
MAGSWSHPIAVRQVEKLTAEADDGHCADEPLLRALWPKRPEAFVPGPWSATCRRRHRGGPVPSAECTCGIHGTTTLAAALRHGNLAWQQCVGVIRPSGRMFLTQPGVWRVERADLVALVDVSAMWDPNRRAARHTARQVIIRGGPVAKDNAVALRLAALASPLYWERIQADHRRVAAAISDRYGVKIVCPPRCDGDTSA